MISSLNNFFFFTGGSVYANRRELKIQSWPEIVKLVPDNYGDRLFAVYNSLEIKTKSR